MYHHGQLTGAISRSREVTAERHAQAELAEAARAFRAMAETSLEGHCRHRPDGTIFWASPAMETLLGYPVKELVGLTGGAIVLDEDRPIRDDAYRRLRATGEPVAIEVRFRHADGSHRWMSMTLRGAFDDAGELVEVHSSRQDITERRDADELRDQWEQTFERTSRGIVVVDPRNEAIQSVNPAFARMLHGEAEDFVGIAIPSLVAEGYQDVATALRRDVAESGYAHVELDFTRPDGTALPVDLEAVASRGADGSLRYRSAT